MHDAPFVRVVDRVADVGHQPHPPEKVRPHLDHPAVQPPTRHEFHRQVRTVAFHPRLVDLRDAGMQQAPEDLDLPVEPLPEGIGREPGVDDLDRNVAARMKLLRLVDDAHPAGAQSPHDPELADPLRIVPDRAFQMRARPRQIAGQRPRHVVRCTRVQLRRGDAVGGQHLLDQGAQLDVGPAKRFERRAPRLAGLIAELLEDRASALISDDVHGPCPGPKSPVRRVFPVGEAYQTRPELQEMSGRSRWRPLSPADCEGHGEDGTSGGSGAGATWGSR